MALFETVFFFLQLGPFETTASAPGSAQASFAPRLFWQLRVLYVRAQGFRREDESRSRGFEKGQCQVCKLLLSCGLHVHCFKINAPYDYGFQVSVAWTQIYPESFARRSCALGHTIGSCDSCHRHRFTWWLHYQQASRRHGHWTWYGWMEVP